MRSHHRKGRGRDARNPPGLTERAGLHLSETLYCLACQPGDPCVVEQRGNFATVVLVATRVFRRLTLNVAFEPC